MTASWFLKESELFAGVHNDIGFKGLFLGSGIGSFLSHSTNTIQMPELAAAGLQLAFELLLCNGAIATGIELAENIPDPIHA